MEAAASIVAFVQVASEITKCIIKFNKLWEEASDLPQDLKDLFEGLNDYLILFEELKEQLEFDNVSTTTQSSSGIARSFNASLKARDILQELVKEMSCKVLSKKDGFQRIFTSLKLATKKEKLERFQKRLKRSMSLLHISIAIYHIATTRRTTETIVSRVTTGFSQQLESIQYTHVPSVTTMEESETKLVKKEKSYGPLTNPSRKAITSSRVYTPSQTGRFAIAYTRGTGSWHAYLQLPSWVSQSVHIFQSCPNISGWSFNYRVYNIVPSDSEIITRIKKGDESGVLELFSSRRASPFDRDASGDSLLYLLLKRGLEETLCEVVGEARQSPLYPLIYEPSREALDADWEKIVNLFQNHLQDPEDLPIARLFDFRLEFTHSDEYVFIFRERFMPKYYTWPIRMRFEAVRLGSFYMKKARNLPRLLSEDLIVTKSDVSLSTHEKLSLVHSAAVSLGIRFADEALPYKRAEFQWPLYTDSWHDFVLQVVAAAEVEDLHSIECVSPWDVYHVPQWRGTPLISLLGGALCYLSPDVSFFHWSSVFRQTLHQWLEDILLVGMDLLEYGERERKLLHNELRGAFDADAIASSRTLTREIRAKASYDSKESEAVRNGWTERHWVPIRIIDLKIGKDIQDWDILWAPEFEHMASNMATRPAKKAGTWYSEGADVLRIELEGFLADVPDSIDGAPLPVSGARVVIAPHAGYSYSGSCAAWAYKALDLSRAKRVFVLGPSHTYILEGCAATTFSKYATPFGDLTIDQELAKTIEDAAYMEPMPQSNEVDEHSLEMHMPYLYLRCEQTFRTPERFPKIVPILVGINKGREEKAIGKVLLPYLKDPENAFIISSDFCHWGHRFSYMVHSPSNKPDNLVRLRKNDSAPTGPPIHETIRIIDEEAMDAVKSGSHDAFLATLRQTGNTVCGRHPIGVMMAALELLGKVPEFKGKGRFSVIQYKRSNLVSEPYDFSVSYVSAYAVL
ncbi:hypothetical protein FZEAL_5118 [Fusarium zealandicum]|uniref:Protein MEMO1 n=1 Tax=Fusarium zealandicum TaxID=1053134 RepID=A0A8H4UL22_9HYPO|nr:hypothetical protein FZEAL_5118 [Fusarium zealandicum]